MLLVCTISQSEEYLRHTLAALKFVTSIKQDLVLAERPVDYSEPRHLEQQAENYLSDIKSVNRELKAREDLIEHHRKASSELKRRTSMADEAIELQRRELEEAYQTIERMKLQVKDYAVILKEIKESGKTTDNEGFALREVGYLRQIEEL